MKIHFYKYQATGNDFVVIDNRSAGISLTREQIAHVCHRRLGIGADGLMLLQRDPQHDFNLLYYNSDGSQSLCGNGSRAAVVFASTLGVMNGKTRFNAYDGTHAAEILPSGVVRLRMNDVTEVKRMGDDFFIHTGSPHFVRFVPEVERFPVYEEGRKIRYDEAFKPGGTNVNFVERLPGDVLFVRTFERGVENETLSCGTGVVASALAASFDGISSPVNIKTPGGELSVEFKSSRSGIFTDIFLIGPAKLVFEGDLEL